MCASVTPSRQQTAKERRAPVAQHIGDPQREFTIPIEGGAWAGETIKVCNYSTRLVRTFV